MLKKGKAFLEKRKEKSKQRKEKIEKGLGGKMMNNRKERKENRRQKTKEILEKTKFGDVMKSYPIDNIFKFISGKIKTLKNEQWKLYNPFGKKIDTLEENLDQIAFHFTIASPMKSVSIKNMVTFYHFYNVYVFLDNTIIKTELDWEKKFDPKEQKTVRSIEECISEEETEEGIPLIYPDYFVASKEKGHVLVQDLEDENSYPSESTFLLIGKKELKEKVQENQLIGKPYDFTTSSQCQGWCSNELKNLKLLDNFSCKMVNEFFGSSKLNKIAGKVIQKFAIERMDEETILKRIRSNIKNRKRVLKF